MSDVFSVAAAYDKPSYVGGDKITVTISGGDVQTVISQSQVGPLIVPIMAADGTTSTINVPMTSVTITTTTPQSVTIDTTKPIIDSSPSPRTWTVSADKLSITATA